MTPRGQTSSNIGTELPSDSNLRSSKQVFINPENFKLETRIFRFLVDPSWKNIYLWTLKSCNPSENSGEKGARARPPVKTRARTRVRTKIFWTSTRPNLVVQGRVGRVTFRWGFRPKNGTDFPMFGAFMGYLDSSKGVDGRPNHLYSSSSR